IKSEDGSECLFHGAQLVGRLDQLRLGRRLRQDSRARLEKGAHSAAKYTADRKREATVAIAADPAHDAGIEVSWAGLESPDDLECRLPGQTSHRDSGKQRPKRIEDVMAGIKGALNHGTQVLAFWVTSDFQ